MATLLAITNVYLLFILTFLSIHFTLAANTTIIKPKPLKLKLHHPDTVFYKPDDTIEDHANRFLNASINRFSYLFEKAGGGDPEYDAHGDLVTDRAYNYGAFFVNFSIGDPPFSQLALMDTGSDLIWIDCASLTAFDPSDSRTFAKYTCLDHDNLPCYTCSSANECMYRIGYVRGGSSEGVLATERFTFETSDEGITIVNDVVFGCSRSNPNTRKLMGVFGLGNLRPGYSIVNKMGNKFSYCIGNLYDKDYKYNQISLGEGTFLEGAATPLSNYNGVYYVDFEGISLGDKTLDIDPNLFKRTSYRKDGVTIDTGAPYTWLVSEAFYVLRAEIAKVIDGLGMMRQYDHVQEWELCYSGTGNLNRDLQSFPLMKFHLGNGANLVLGTTSMFYQSTRKRFCLAFGPSSHNGYDYLSIIGLMAQQNHNIVYDLMGKKLYIQRIECSLLEED